MKQISVITWARTELKFRIATLLGSLILANIACLLFTWNESQHYRILFSAGLLAYGFGLRHAVDADHISAIDNTTRKLMQEGKRPIGVGFFFSLGHSSVVVLLCAALAVSSAYVQHHLHQWQTLGGIAGTLISGFFLYLIGFINLVVLFDLYKMLRRKKGDGSLPEDQLETALVQRGLLGRLFRPLLRMISSSRQMYVVGFLFGLGFDTATEVGLLALAARSGQTGLPFWTIMLLPLLFTAGMCLIDTADGILMLRAYGWAFITPMRKLYYNFSITSLSVLVAFLVGTYEILQIVQEKFALQGKFWSFVSTIDFSRLGYMIVATFLIGWVVFALIYKLRKQDGAEALFE
jgi:high-affinity nickel-transport protein